MTQNKPTIDQMNETWLPVPVPMYSNYYLVSSMGRVKSIDKEVNSYNGKKLIKGRILKQAFGNGYLRVRLSNKNHSDNFTVHRLVALAFIPNPENKPTVNHKKGIKTDNRATELEWATYSEQQVHAISTSLYTPSNPMQGKFGHAHNRSKPVSQFALDGNFIGEYGSTCQAAKITGFSQTGISKCCRGELKSHKGYTWAFNNQQTTTNEHSR